MIHTCSVVYLHQTLHVTPDHGSKLSYGIHISRIATPNVDMLVLTPLPASVLPGSRFAKLTKPCHPLAYLPRQVFVITRGFRVKPPPRESSTNRVTDCYQRSGILFLIPVSFQSPASLHPISIAFVSSPVRLLRLITTTYDDTPWNRDVARHQDP